MVPVIEMVIQGVTSGPGPHFLGAGSEGVCVRPSSLRRFAVRLPDVGGEVKRKENVASFDMRREVKFGD
jgi:hypothetical protein